MSISKKLETIYYNGQPDGIRSIRRHLSTITTYVIPRPLLSEAKKISGITRPGIYYLINENDENKIAQIYIDRQEMALLGSTITIVPKIFGIRLLCSLLIIRLFLSI